MHVLGQLRIQEKMITYIVWVVFRIHKDVMACKDASYNVFSGAGLSFS